MNQAWYQVVSLLFGYLSAAAIAVIVFCAVQGMLADALLMRRMKKHTPFVGTFALLRVIGGGTRRLPIGYELSVPYEGTMGASHSCDVYIPYRRVHMRSAFFWAEEDGLHMVALHKDGLFADNVPVGPGDEAILSDGAELRVRGLTLLVCLNPAAIWHKPGIDIGPYVTPARKTRAQQGHSEGIGAPGKAAVRREKKIQKKLEAHPEKAAKKTRAKTEKQEIRTGAKDDKKTSRSRAKKR